MKISVKEISSVEKKLTITIDKDKVAKEYGSILANVRKNAVIKGFRKGKAPKNIIEGNYAGKIREELVTRLIEGSFLDALKEKNLSPVTQPKFEMVSFNKDEEFVYNITVELMPEFDLKEYSGLNLEAKNTEIDDSEVLNTLKNLQEQSAVFKETTDNRKVKESDMVIFDFKGFKSDGSMIKDGQKENFSVVVGSNNLIPGFEENLIDLRKGEEKEFTVTFPEDYFEKEYAGVDVKFEVKIKEIKEKELPEIDDEFTKNYGDYKDLKEFKVFLKKQLKEEKEKARELGIREQIVDKLIETNSFEVPNSLVEKQIDYIVNETKQRLMRQGADVSRLSEPDARENSKDMALKMVKRDLILGKIVEKEGFKVEADEMETKYKELADSMGRTVKDIKEFYKRVNAEQALRDDILIQKVFRKITDSANIKELS